MLETDKKHLFFKDFIKSRIIKNEKIIKIIFIILSILIIYLSKHSNCNFQVFHKKYAIQYLKKFFSIYLNNIEFIKSNNYIPHISIIIPLYNCQNTIEMSIKSIEMQQFKNYEIVLINDYSEDNSTTIINKIKENDSRIRIINNKKNMGILYSRSIGALTAKGKYIFCLDNDDLFYDENLFDRIFEIAETKKYDIIEFKSFYIKKMSQQIKFREIKESPFNEHPINYTLTQPELGLFPISRNNKLFVNDHHIWGKSIRSILYKKAVNILSMKNYLIYNCYTEDISMIFIIFNLAKTFFFVNIYGIIHYVYKQSTMHTLSDSKKLMAEIFLLNIITDFIHNKEQNKHLILQKFESIIKSKFYLSVNFKHIKLLNLILKKIIQIRTLGKKDKKYIFKFMNQSQT